MFNTLHLMPPLFFANMTKRRYSFSNHEIKNKKKDLSPWKITGFFDAEGHFGINITKSKSKLVGWQVSARIVLELHSEDLETLLSILEFFKVGKVYVQNKRNSVRYEVTGLKIYKYLLVIFYCTPYVAVKL